MQRETKDSSARDLVALREAGCHRCALRAVLSSSPTWLGSPEPRWDRESIAPPGRHSKLSLPYRCRGPPSSPAVENEEHGGGGPRAGRFLPPPSQPQWDCRGPLFPTGPALTGAALPLLGCGESPQRRAGRCRPFGRPRRSGPAEGRVAAAPGPALAAAVPAAQELRLCAEGAAELLLRGWRGAERPQAQRPAAFRDASVWRREKCGGEGEGEKKEEWGDNGCLPPFPEPGARASPKVRAAPRGFAPPLPACSSGLSPAARIPPGTGRAGAEEDAFPPANAPAGCLQPRPALSSPCSREPLRLTVLIKLPSPSVGNSELSPSYV